MMKFITIKKAKTWSIKGIQVNQKLRFCGLLANTTKKSFSSVQTPQRSFMNVAEPQQVDRNGFLQATNPSLSSQNEDSHNYWEISDRTSLEFELDDQQGALFKVVEVFKRNNLNQTSIMSKPPKKINDKKVMMF